MSLASGWTQVFPPRNGAPLTEGNLPSQLGKVFVVTGGSSGLGYHLSRVLYGAGAKVYMLTRTRQHAEEAITRIEAHYRDNDGKDTPGAQRGSLKFIYMDLLDFATVQDAARQVLESEGPEGRLDVLFNNAGTGAMSNAPKSKQGCEYHFCVNSVGAHLLTRLLTPLLSETSARSSEKDAVRVVWPASMLVEMMSPRDGIRKTFLEDPDSVASQNELYTASKTANWFLASEFSRRQAAAAAGHGTTSQPPPRVVHIAGNPGNYLTNIWRTVPSWTYYLTRPILRDPIHGVETYLWMAFSDSVTFDRAVGGGYAICDGRWHPGQRKDLLLALKGVDEGGSGRASEYYDWCEARVKDFVN